MTETLTLTRSKDDGTQRGIDIAIDKDDVARGPEHITARYVASAVNALYPEMHEADFAKFRKLMNERMANRDG
jgi:hypothetical protein